MISIDGLTISFDGKKAVSGISLELRPGEILGLVGESGSGKSVTALTLMGLLSDEAVMESGKVTIGDTVILEAGKKPDEKLLRSYRGSHMSMVFQEPMTSLNPTMKVGPQVAEQLILHASDRYPKPADRKRCVVEAFESVGLHDAEALYDKYPHQLSGGMRQRVMIAMAVILHPELIIADEPTTALDVTIQNQIVRLLKDINARENNSMLFITHDLNLARRICTRLLVMKDGCIVERGATEDIFTNPGTEYAKKLISAVPGRKRSAPQYAGEDCACSRQTAMMPENPDSEDKKDSDRADIAPAKKSILTVTDLCVYYKERSKKPFGGNIRRKVVHAAKFDIYEGETLGLVGESGCGKSSLCKAILGINRNIKGKIEHRTIRPQMIFQDPYSSLNPMRTIGWQLEEPLYTMDAIRRDIKTTKEWRREQAMEMLGRVGLDESYYYRYPHQLSGGQRQRVSIAQALMTKPKLIFADEPVSALDVTIQDQVLDLLKSLQDEFGIAYLFISHDINVIYRVSDRIMVMKDGRILEIGDREQVFNSPSDPYTRELLEES
ncbi:MAG: ABC transporter ATP-binding protein [Lachnospiraceae bacterium]|nr:ABC transporter ATP-binding protein [Lachnospiraceae bacterium]